MYTVVVCRAIEAFKRDVRFARFRRQVHLGEDTGHAIMTGVEGVKLWFVG